MLVTVAVLVDMQSSHLVLINETTYKTVDPVKWIKLIISLSDMHQDTFKYT